MSDAIFLQIDEVTKRIVGGNTTGLSLYHPCTEIFHVQIVRTSKFGLNITIQDKSASALRIILSSKPNAIPSISEGAPVIYAEATSDQWTWDATNQWFAGGLNLDTSELRSKIREKSSVALFLFILLTTDGTEKVIYGPTRGSSNVNIEATPASSLATASAPEPEEDFLTEVESDQRYMEKLPSNANYRFKDGLFQLWSDYYYSLDNTKPWYAPVFDTADGPRPSGPIAD